MIYKHFRVNLIFRIILIALSLGVLMYCVFVSQLYLRSIYVFIFVVFAVAELIHYVDKTNRDISSFLMAILQNDFTNTYSEKSKGKSFADLYAAFNKITEQFRLLSADKEAQFLYLEMLVEHVKVGILSFDETGHIHLMNEAMKKLVSRSHVHSLKALELTDKTLVDVFHAIRPGENKLVNTIIENKVLQLAIHAAEFKLQGKHYKLVSAQNIKNELEAKEMEAWQKLIRVLTHEIMNSVSPIASLSHTLHTMVKTKKGSAEWAGAAVMENLEHGLEAIKVRSEGLQNFTQAYRSLTKIPQPVFATLNIREWLLPIGALFENELALKNIAFNILIADAQLEIAADKELLAQVIVNLVRNAIDAVGNTPNPEIIISAYAAGDKVHILVRDNGQGIPPDMLDKIYIPFFTTKKNGSGIGLALSKQILQLHNAQLQVQSEEGRGAVFSIQL